MSRAPLLVRSVCSAWLMAIVLLVSGMGLYTAHNDFPFYYHPDEKGKVRQIAEHSRNYKHPLLLLTASSLVTKFCPGPQTPQQIVQGGRAVSAFFAAAAVVAMALLGRRMAGALGGPLAAVLGGWSVGALVLLNASMFDFAHYMKEDPALVMGMALTFLALHVFWTRRDDASLLFLGAATATAVSGKYIGWLLFPFVVWIVLRGCEPAARKRSAKLFLKSFALVWAILNYSLIFDPFKPFSSLAGEMKGVVGGHRGLTKDVPHAVYLRAFLGMPLAIQALFAVYLTGLLARMRKVTPAEWLVPGLALLLTVMMSFSPKASPRYFLPVEMTVCFGAGLGAVWAATWLASFCGRARQVVLAAAWALLFGAALWNVSPALEEHCRAMTVDDRIEFKAWIARHVPTTAVIAEDGRVHLPVANAPIYEREPRMPHTVLESEYAADLGTVPQLRAKGVTHVAIDTLTFMRYDMFRPTAKKVDEFARHRAFYASFGVLKDSQPLPGIRQLWSSNLGTNVYLQPGIYFFDISGVAPEPAQNN